jgi:dephospho-CoA kinase
MTADRGWSREDAEDRIAAQASPEDRRAIATYVIDNSGTVDELRKQVEKVYAELEARRHGRPPRGDGGRPLRAR